MGARCSAQVKVHPTIVQAGKGQGLRGVQGWPRQGGALSGGSPGVAEQALTLFSMLS